MTASGKITVGWQTSEVGSDPWDAVKKFGITTTPDRKFFNHMQQAVADTEEALDIGDLGTIGMVIVHCITNDADIDPNFSATFKAGVTVAEGEWAVFQPAGTMYLKNNDAAEQSEIEYWIIGTQA